MRVGTLLHPSWLARALLTPGEDGALASLVKRCMGEGATHIELTGEAFTLAPPALVGILEKEIREGLLACKEEDGVSFSLHMPHMGGLDLSSSIEGIRRVTLETYSKLFTLVRPLEPLGYVIHVAGMIQEAAGGLFTGKATARLRALLLENVRQSLKALSTMVDARSICIENLPYYPMEFVAPLVEELDLSICLDIGHLTLRGDSLEGFLQTYGPRIRLVHFHDVKQVQYGPNVHIQLDHQGLGHGSLPLPHILSLLGDSGFDGPLVLETLHHQETTSISDLRDLVAALGAPDS